MTYPRAFNPQDFYKEPGQISEPRRYADLLDDLPDEVLNQGQAWKCCQSKRVNPKRFGIFRMRGLDFVKGDLIRDFLALNKVEVLPWDNFLLINISLIHIRPEEKELMNA